MPLTYADGECRYEAGAFDENFEGSGHLDEEREYRDMVAALERIAGRLTGLQREAWMMRASCGFDAELTYRRYRLAKGSQARRDHNTRWFEARRNVTRWAAEDQAA